jgi:hypothetical protein
MTDLRGSDGNGGEGINIYQVSWCQSHNMKLTSPEYKHKTLPLYQLLSFVSLRSGASSFQ